MNKEKVSKVVSEIIIDRITQLIEDMSNHDFVEFVMDRLEQEGVNIDPEDEEGIKEVEEVIGSRFIPLLHKMSEYVVGKNIPVE